jgi:hypothetical protein
VGDGATNNSGAPVLNVLLVRGNAVEFVKAKDCSGHVKNARYIADDMISVIMDREDPKDVVAVLMDNATRASWPLIEKACPWVVCAPCGPHVVDLLQEDVGKLSFFKDLFVEAQALRVFIRTHSHVLAAYNADPARKTKISNPGSTRFSTSVIGLDNLLWNRAAIASTMVAPAVLEAMEKVKTDRLEGKFPTLGDLFKYLQGLVVNRDFWVRVEWATKVLKPMSKLLRFMEQDAPTMSKVYYAWFEVKVAIEAMDLPAALKKSIVDLVAYRWDYGYSILQGAGCVLDPEFRLCETNEECDAAFDAYVLKVHPKPVAVDFQSPEELAVAKTAHTALLLKIRKQLLAYQMGDGPWGRGGVMKSCWPR